MYQILVIFVLKWAERSSQHRERFIGERFTSVPQISGGEAQKTIVSYSSLCQHTCQSKQPHLTHYIPNSFMVLGSKHAFFLMKRSLDALIKESMGINLLSEKPQLNIRGAGAGFIFSFLAT